MVENVYYHKVNGIYFTEKYCSKCIWYNSIQSVDKKTGNYIINCANETCKHGNDKFNQLINGLLYHAFRNLY